MIVAEGDGGHRFITQPDHAALAGRFAERWGNDRVTPPAVPGSAILAAHGHDAGWWAWDLRPRLTESGDPAGFLAVAAEQWTDFYASGIDAVVEADPYAGLLCSMHGAGVRRQRYGTHPEIPDRTEAFGEFIRREERRQRRLVERLQAKTDAPVTADTREFLEALHQTGSTPVDADAEPVWNDYRRLQVWDRLSLHLCSGLTYESTAIGPVPMATGVAKSTITVHGASEATVRLDPYPFDESPLTVGVDGRCVADDAWHSESELIQAYFEAGIDRVEFTLQG